MIPDARLVRLPACGHVPMNDDPAAVARIILDTDRWHGPLIRAVDTSRGQTCFASSRAEAARESCRPGPFRRPRAEAAPTGCSSAVGVPASAGD